MRITMSHLTVVQLKRELKKKGCKLVSTMRKADLVLLWEQTLEPKNADHETPKNNPINGFTDPFEEFFKFRDVFTPLRFSCQTMETSLMNSLFDKWNKREMRLILVNESWGISDLAEVKLDY